jgi:hypothetical protein
MEEAFSYQQSAVSFWQSSGSMPSKLKAER